MPRVVPVPLFAAALLCAGLAGCATDHDTWRAEELRGLPTPRPPAGLLPPTRQPEVVPAGFTAQPAELPPPRPAPPTQPPAAAELTPETVVWEVLARSPTLEAMRAAAEAATARYPQVTSLDDPTLAVTTAPGSAWSPNVDFANRVEISQKLFYPGKRGLRGQVSAAEAAAAARDIDDTRLSLAEAAKAALADYYLAEKGTEVARENLKILREFRPIAEANYKVGKAPQQDILQADVEIARQEERLVSLRRARAVAVARINTLMHLPPDSPLPPPAGVRTELPPPDATELRTTAAAARPDLKAAVDRVAAEEAALALALKEYNPDVELMAAYDGFWQGANGRPLQWQVGARVNLPVRYGRRAGAVAEARAKVAQRRAELGRLTDRANYEVQEAVERVREADDIIRLYEKTILPAAGANVKEARVAYENAKIPFLTLVEAQRNHVTLKDRYYETVAEAVRRRAALERAVGAPMK